MSIKSQKGASPVDPDRIVSRQEFAAALTHVRERAGLTVRQVAKIAGVPAATVGGYFGGRHVPQSSQADVLAKVLRACGVTDEVTLQRWWAACCRVRRAPGPRPADAPVPYRGLRTYQPEDAPWFCGRAELSRQVMERLASRCAAGNGLLMLVGPSGAGKSSLLRAGLVPALRADGLPGSSTGPSAVLLFSPGRDPLRRLHDKLAVAEPAAGEQRLVVVVDQFEELFATEINEETRAEFVTELDRLATGRDGSRSVAVMVGLRADFYGHALAYPTLAAASQTGQVVVGPMTTEQLREVITEPARRAGVDIDDGLVEVMLRELAPPADGLGRERAHPAGVLPLLSHALLVTWEHGQGRRLTIAGYRDSGGLDGAVAQTAERVLAELAESEQELARRLFLRLVRVSPDGTDTDRRVRRVELTAGRDAAESAALFRVAEQFIASRLLTVDAATVQISHEALLHAWPRLRTWIDSDRAGLVIGQRLVEAAHAWDQEDRDPAALYRGSRLSAARDWAATRHRELPSLVNHFLNASLSRERRGVRRLYRALAALAVLLALAITTGAVAVQQRSHALAQERLATAERDQALSRLVAGRAERIRDKDVSLAAQLSLAAYQIWPTAEAHAALMDSSASHTATRLLGSTGVMQSVTLSPDRRTLAAGTADRTVLLWDLSDPQRPTRLQPALTGPDDVVYSVAFSPDGRTLAAGSGDNRIHLWDTTNPHQPRSLGRPLTGPTALVYSVAFSPDGRTLAAGSGDNRIHLWDTTNPHQPIRRAPLEGADGYVQSVTFSPSGGLLAAGDADATVRLWDVRGSDRPVALGRPLTKPKQTVFAVAFSPDEQTLVAGSRDGNLYLWDITDPQRPQPFEEPLAGASGWVQAAAFSPDGNTLAAASSGQTWLWDWRTARVTAVLPHPGPVTSLVYGEDQQTLITAAADGTARLWRLPGPSLPGDDVPVNNLRFSSDGRMLAVASGEASLWSLEEHTRVGPPITNPTGFSGAIAITPDANTLIVSDRDGHLRSWDVADPRRPAPLGRSLEAHSLLIEQMALNPEGTVLATAGDDNLVRLWDVSNPGAPALLAELDGFSKLVYSVLFNPDGDLLAAASVDYTVRIWDVSDPGQPVPLGEPLISSDHYAMSLAVHPDQPILAVGSGDKNIYLWDISEPHHPIQLGPPLVGPENYVYALAYSPDGTTLAAANTDETLWLWDVSDPEQPSVRATLTAGHGPLYAVAFSPDGTSLAAGGGGNKVWLWNTDLDQIGAHICRTAGEPLTQEEWVKYLPGYPYQRVC